MSAFYKIFQTERLSTSGLTWGIEIWRKQDSEPDSVGELEPVAGNGLVIEWKATSKEDVLCGSVATLTLNSPGDRTYIGLYTYTPGSVQLRVYRGGSLYWIGFLDPEFYEEPFTRGFNYNVSLTFSDFGILDRLNYNLTGVQSLYSIVHDCMIRAGLESLQLNFEKISTIIDWVRESDLYLGDISVLSANFYDEDGEPMKLSAVLEGVLRPLALRVTQRCGVLYIFDINDLYQTGTTQVLKAGASDCVLGVDRVYNNVKITLSAYNSDKFAESFEYTGEIDLPSGKSDNYSKNAPSGPLEYYSFHSDYAPRSGYEAEDLSFRLFVNTESPYGQLLQPGLRFFKIMPFLDGQEEDGFSFLFYTGASSRHSDLTGWESDSSSVARHGYLPGGTEHEGLADDAELFRSNRVFVTPQSPEYLLRLQMKVLLDARYNPFTKESEDNEATAIKKLYNTRRLYLPLKVELLDDSDNVLYHYSNYDAIARLPSMYLGQWIQGEQSGPAACMLVFDQNPDEWKDADVNQAGWVGNRQRTLMDDKRGTLLSKAAYGQYMPIPPTAGWLRVTVLAGMRRSEKDFTPAGDTYTWKNSHDLLRWILFTVPKIDVVNNDATYSEVSPKDVVYSGVINANAREDLEINEVCGAPGTALPTARAVLMHTISRDPLMLLKRAGIQGYAEQLLAGTLFSQYAERKIKLSGTFLTDGFDLVKVEHPALPGKDMMIMEERQSCLSGDSEITAIEIAPDEYVETSI